MPSTVENNIQPILDWISRFPIVKHTVELKSNKAVIFGGFLRQLILNHEKPISEQKTKIIKYFKNGGDIDISFDPSNTNKHFQKFFKKRPISGTSPNWEIYEYEKKKCERIIEFNSEYQTRIQSIEHNKTDYLDVEQSKDKFLHFHIKVKGNESFIGKNTHGDITLDLTHYSYNDKNMSYLNYDFSINMLACEWNSEKQRWVLWSRLPKLEISQIIKNIRNRKYEVVGGRRHIKIYRYFNMARRGFYPQSKYEPIFISNLLVSNNSDPLFPEVLQYVLDMMEDSLKKMVKTQGPTISYNFVRFLSRCLVVSDDIAEKYIKLFEEPPVVSIHGTVNIWKVTNLKQFKKLETMIKFKWSPISGFEKQSLFEDSNTIEEVEFVVEKVGKLTTKDINTMKYVPFDIMKMIIKQHDGNEPIDWEVILKKAIQNNDTELAEHIQSHVEWAKFDMNLMWLSPEFDFDMLSFILENAMMIEDMHEFLYEIVDKYPISNKTIDLLFTIQIDNEYIFNSFVIDKIIQKILDSIKDPDSEEKAVSNIHHLKCQFPSWKRVIYRYLRTSSHPMTSRIIDIV